MKRIVFWLDPISPFAYLAFERLPVVLEGLSHAVEYRPVLFGAMLKHWGTVGPAEVEPKRAWTFRHVHWLAQAHGIPLDTPLRHPFNPLALLRLLVAAGANRHHVGLVLQHVWRGGGADALDPARLAALHAALGESHPTMRDPDDDAVKAELRASTDDAIARGVFGVPSFGITGPRGDPRVFWGLDALPMLRAALEDDAWFDGPAWAREGAPREGVRRAR